MTIDILEKLGVIYLKKEVISILIILLIMSENSRLKLPSDYTPEELFRVDLTAEQMAAICSLLPKGYSLHLDNRRKDTKNQNKKKIVQDINPQSLSEQSFKQKQNIQQSQQKKPKGDVITEAIKPCLKILQSLQQHKCALPFLEPVDVEALNIPEYREIVKEPMDLSTIEAKLKGGKYQTPSQFHSDVVKIFHNSYLFNEVNEDFVKITGQLEKYYYRISGETKPPVDKSLIKPVLTQPKSQKKKKKPIQGSREPNDSQPITLEQKKELAGNLHRLAKEHIKGVKSIVFDNNNDQNQFDLQQLSQKKLRQLQKYIRNKINEMENNLRSNLIEKSQQQNLDELQSDQTEKFINQKLEM